MKDRYRGCLLASAAGDALGAPLEFIRDEAGLRRLGGDRGVRDLLPAYGRLGAVTDDTQMTVATAEGLLQATGSGEADLVASVHRAYLGWYRSQTVPENRRGPGNTCLSALGSGRMGTVAEPINNSKGSGGVMRVSPVGLAFPGDPDRAFAVGVATAATTHGHPGGYLPAGFLAALVARLVEALPLHRSVDLELARPELGGDLRDRLTEARDLAAGPLPPWAAFSRMNAEGWTGDEGLAIGLFCALRHEKSLEDAVVTAAYHVGDTDTTGAVAGAIAGAHLREVAIPGRWLAALEWRTKIEDLAERLHARFTGR
jgi:ADP-ribosylglycohydrolase